MAPATRVVRTEGGLHRGERALVAVERFREGASRHERIAEGGADVVDPGVVLAEEPTMQLERTPELRLGLFESAGGVQHHAEVGECDHHLPVLAAVEALHARQHLFRGVDRFVEPTLIVQRVGEQAA
jgi:hypothetical protein